MDHQATFETVARHLLLQGKVSTGAHGCSYSGGGGLKCALGCLIPDAQYDPVFEGVYDSSFIEREFPPRQPWLPRPGPVPL